MNDPFLELCGICDGKPAAKGAETKEGGKYIPAPFFERNRVRHQLAEPVIVYILGTVEGVAQIDVYSSVNGYHIRTIPGDRWMNPVLIGAGAGFLAVIDRRGDHDILCVTDEYAGAGTAGFDSNGFPVTTIAWRELPNIMTIDLPAGYECTGIKISPNGILLAGLKNPGNPLETRFIKADPTYFQANGSHYAPYWGDVFLRPPFDALGYPVGNITVYTALPSTRRHEFGVILVSGSGHNYFFLLDAVSGEMRGGSPLPSSIRSCAVTPPNISFLGFNANANADAIYRIRRQEISSFHLSHLRKRVPNPDNYAVNQSITLKGLPTNAALGRQADVSRSLNRDTPDSVTITGVETIDTTTSDALMENPTVNSDDVLTPGNGLPKVPVQSLSLPDPDTYGLIQLEQTHGTITALLKRASTEDLLFRVVHGTHFDWVSEGGYTYGCEDAKITNGLSPLCLATDSGVTPGKLKDLPDLKVALIDVKYNLFQYLNPKPKGYNFYGGKYATFQSTSQRTSCADAADTAITDIDALVRPDMTPVRTLIPDYPPISRFAATADYDSPWTYFNRSVKPIPPLTVSVFEKTWSTRHPDLNYIQPEWRELPAPASYRKLNGDHGQMFFPPFDTAATDTPTLRVSSRSGFYPLNWEKVHTTNHAEWQLDIEERQTQVLALESRHDPALQDQIDALNNEIATLQNNIATTDLLWEYVIPRSLVNTKFEVETSPALSPETPAAPIGTFVKNQVYAVTGIKRGVAVDDMIRSWIAIDVKLDRGGLIKDGQDHFYQDDYFRNRLGTRIAKSTGTGNPIFESTPGYVYEIGHRASPYGDGAEGIWELKIDFVEDLGRGKFPQSEVRSAEITTDEGLYDRAPTDAIYILNQYYGVEGGVSTNGLRKCGVWATKALIKKVVITARLVNYAYEVYRIGYRTTEFKHAWAPVCLGADTGVGVFINCEASRCGNVDCGSQITGTKNKLYDNDPVTPVTRQILWEGRAEYTWDNDPYLLENMIMGRLMTCDFYFDLMGAMNNYKIDIRQDNYTSL